jgi:hypothetical protein
MNTVAGFGAAADTAELDFAVSAVHAADSVPDPLCRVGA